MNVFRLLPMNFTVTIALTIAVTITMTVLAAPSFAFDLNNLENQLGTTLQQGNSSSPGNSSNSSGNRPHSAALDNLSDGEVGAGLKAALDKGVNSAVSTLGRADGFYGNPKWRIPLPHSLQRASDLMHMAGMGDQADALDLAINRAAEAAVPQAKDLLVRAVKNMSLTDVKHILTGGPHSATDYFRQQTEAPLTQRFLPIAREATAKVKLASIYDRYAGQAEQFGLIKPDESNLNSYITQQALDRLYQAIGDEESAIRANPVSAGSALISKVFGAL